MFNISEVIRKNSETFYDYRSGARKSVIPRLLFIAFCAAALWFTLSNQSDNFLSAILTMQSILVGFSFSVLFFLLSNNDVTPQQEESIERDITRKRVNTLAKELFYNVCYFNIVAISSVVLTLIIMSAGIDVSAWKSLANWTTEYTGPIPLWVSGWLDLAPKVIRNLALVALYGFLLEATYTFYRTVTRVGYYFEQKLKLLQPIPEAEAPK